MDIIKGSSVTDLFTVYSYWTGTASTSTIADITGATIKLYVKLRAEDADVDALLTLNGAVTDGINGIGNVPFAAADTNTIPFSNVFYEIVVKLTSGSFIRSGVQPFNIKPNVMKTLF